MPKRCINCRYYIKNNGIDSCKYAHDEKGVDYYAPTWAYTKKAKPNQFNSCKHWKTKFFSCLDLPITPIIDKSEFTLIESDIEKALKLILAGIKIKDWYDPKTDILHIYIGDSPFCIEKLILGPTKEQKWLVRNLIEGRQNEN